MNKNLTLIIMGIMATTLLTIGFWHVTEDAKWIWIIGIGVFGMMETNRVFNSLPKGEIEEEEDKDKV